MYSTIILAIGLYIATSSAQGPISSILPTTMSSSSSVCDDYWTTNCVSVPSITPTTSTSSSSLSPTTHTINTKHSSRPLHNNTTSKTMPTITTSYTNSTTSSTHFTTLPSNTIPTSILVATGTPVVPSIRPSTITSFTVVQATPTGSSSSQAPTTQSTATREGKLVGLPGLALVVLVVSSLVLV